MTTSHITTPAPALIVSTLVDGDDTGTFGPFATWEERDTWVSRMELEMPNAIFRLHTMFNPDSI